MSDLPEVSIIIPLYNNDEYLKKTLESIRLQSFKEFEILLVVDRPTLELWERVKKLESIYNLRLLLSPGAGIVDALNFGIHNSRADLIARIDADDEMFPDRIQTQIDFMRSHPLVTCVGSQIEFIDELGNILKRSNYPTSHNAISKQLNYLNCLAHPSVMFRKKKAVEIGCYRKYFTGAEDYDLWLRLSRVSKLANINRPLTKYRISNNQYTNELSPFRINLDSRVRYWNLIESQNRNFIPTPKGTFISQHDAFSELSNLNSKNKKVFLVGIIVNQYLGKTRTSLHSKSNILNQVKDFARILMLSPTLAASLLIFRSQNVIVGTKHDD